MLLQAGTARSILARIRPRRPAEGRSAGGSTPVAAATSPIELDALFEAVLDDLKAAHADSRCLSGLGTRGNLPAAPGPGQEAREDASGAPRNKGGRSMTAAKAAADAPRNK